MSYNNRNNYTHIQAFGTPSAFDPSRISKSNTPCSTASPYRVIDVTVSLRGTEAKEDIVLGAPLEIGSVILQASIKGTNLLSTTTFGICILNTPQATPSDFPSFLPTPNIFSFPITTTGTVANAGLVNVTASTPIVALLATPSSTVPTGTLCPAYPVLRVDAMTSPDTGSVNVKMIIFSP